MHILIEFVFVLLQRNTTPDIDTLFDTAYAHDDIKHEISPKRMRS